MYKQTLYKIITPVKSNTISRLNKAKKWEYGYNKEHDIVVISKTGQIGDIYNIQNPYNYLWALLKDISTNVYRKVHYFFLLVNCHTYKVLPILQTELLYPFLYI